MSPAIAAPSIAPTSEHLTPGTTLVGEPARAADPEHLPPGTRVSRYEIVGVVGSGGMGVVYRARDPYLSRDIALKVMSPLRVDRGGVHHARLLREAQALAKLAHPNVVAAFDVGDHAGGVFVAMELVDGESLATWLRTARPRRDVIRALVDAGRGLAAAHAAGLLHRDISPANLMVSPDGRVRVVDFGLVRALHTDEPASDAGDEVPFLSVGLSAAGAIAGTPGYLAPEHVLGEELDARSDQFAFAATAFAALTGRAAYDASDLDGYRAALVAGRRTPWPALPAVPGRVRRVIDRGLSPRRDDRFPTMTAAVDALERTLRAPRWVIAVNAVALAGLGLALVAARPAAAPPVCSPGGSFEAAWSAPRADALAAAFARTALPGADAAYAQVAARLDVVRDRWLDATRAACEDTHVHHRQPASVLALRSACLDRARAETGEFVDALSERVDPAFVDRAATAVLSVGAIDECVAVRELIAHDEQLAPEPARRRGVAPLLDALASMRAHTAAGGLGSTLPALRGLVAAADVVGDPATTARARLDLGDSLAHAGFADEADVEFAAALRLATIARAPRTLARAANRLLHRAILRQRFAQAQHILPFVEAVIDLAKPSAGAALVLIDKAAIAANDFAYAEALALLARAAAYADATPEDVDELQLQLATEWALTLDTAGDLAGAEAKFREAVALARDLYGDRHRVVLAAYTNVVATQVERERFAEAEATLTELRPLVAAVPATAPESIRLTLAEGTLWQARGDCARAVDLFTDAMAREVERAGADTGAVATVLHIRIGKCLRALARPAEAAEHFARWLAVRVDEEAAPDYQAEAAFLLAQARWEAGAHRRARVDARLALARYDEAGANFAEERAEVAAWIAARGRAR
jgi:tRNA A-37 threonylcarbamoyl transferase component Bud32